MGWISRFLASGEGDPVDPDLARGGVEETGKYLQRGGLSRTVGADQRVDLGRREHVRRDHAQPPRQVGMRPRHQRRSPGCGAISVVAKPALAGCTPST